MNTSPTQSQAYKPAPIPGRFAFEPMPEGASPPLVIEALLKYPGRIIHELQNNWRAALPLWLLSLALLGMLAYGVVVGSFSGGTQLWIAPAKIAMGTTLSILICLPSLYIFTCLSGIEAQMRTVTGMLFAAVGLGALLLIGFAPIAWIFSQSTDSVAFMAALHIGLWAIGIMFGLRLLEGMGHLLGGSARNHLKLWSVIFIVVSLQMMTTLRPIVGTSDRFLPTEKKFFLTHWAETLRMSQQKNDR
ncbi:MAG TPA: hypothetical protein VKE29_08265 [Candidatus Udaeobacter sp.]|nr:hypothetical protein [Candidatus Udaeobacter sp.]